VINSSHEEVDSVITLSHEEVDPVINLLHEVVADPVTNEEFDIEMDELDPVVELAIYESTHNFAIDNPITIIQRLRRNLTDLFEMVVSRSTILENSLRRIKKISFDPTKKLMVVFDAEKRIDTGV
jgi:hypothetical protein